MTTTRTAPTLTAVLAVLVLFATAAAFAAEPPAVRNLTGQFASLGGDIDDLQALEVGGIVILRGKTPVRSVALAAGARAQALGYSRVANLIQVTDPPDDAELSRDAQRELAIHHQLEGTRLSVDAENGVIFLRGSVSHEMQKDLAIAVVRSVDGVREVRDQIVRR